MSDKRFTVDDDGIYDTQEKKHFKFIAYDWIKCDIYECCDLLNEQQATITAQKKGLDEYMDNIIALSKENEQLRQQHQKLYNYFRDYLEDEMSAENFGEMWDNVKEDERWTDG